jgi:hypothetical protein
MSSVKPKKFPEMQVPYGTVAGMVTTGPHPVSSTWVLYRRLFDCELE